MEHGRGESPGRRRRPATPLVLCLTVLAPLAAFAYLAEVERRRSGVGADDRLLRLAHRHAGPLLDAVLGGGTHLGSIEVVAPAIVAVALVLAARGRRTAALFPLLALAGTLVI